MNKKDHTHTQWNINYLAIKKNEINAIHSNMEGPRDYYTKWCNSEREQQTSLDITYMWNLKYDKWTHLWNRNRLTDTENRLLVAGVVGRGGLGGWGYIADTSYYT